MILQVAHRCVNIVGASQNIILLPAAFRSADAAFVNQQYGDAVWQEGAFDYSITRLGSEW